MVSRDGSRVIDVTKVHDWLVPWAWEGGSGVLCLGHEDGRRRVRRVSLSGDFGTPLEPPGSVESVTVYGDEILVVRSELNTVPDLLQ